MRGVAAPAGVRLLGALVLAAALAGAMASRAHAEGSAQLYPVNAACASNASAGSCRANIEWRTSAYGPATGAQVRRRTFLQLYAAAGEVIVMGSSAVGVGAGDVLVYDPGAVTDSDAQPLPAVTTGVNGFRCSDQRTSSGIASQGMITTRAQELAGAQAVTGGGNPTGYVPCSYVAPVSGIYGLAFYGPSGDGNDTDGGVTAQIDLASASNFDATQVTSVAAWDVTVRSDATSTADLTGRVFTQALVAFTGANGRPLNVSVYVVTRDGFRYRTDTRGLDPNGFAFYGNQQGFLDGDGTTPLYHDAYGTTNSGQLTALAGGVTFAAPTFPIFFGAPADATLTALGIPLTPSAPSISALTFAGNVAGSTSSVGGGGTFSYTATTPGVYEIVISRDGVNFDPGDARNRALRGVRTAGLQSVAWDGKDNSDADFPVGANYAVRGSLHAGEYHFPLIDAENSTLGGPTVTLLNPPGGVCPLGGSCTTAFFDGRGYHTVGPNAATVGTAPPPDAPLCGTGPPPAPYHSDPVTGFDTAGALRAFGTDGSGNSNTPCGGSYGDVKGLDMWTFFPTANAASALAIVAPGAPSAPPIPAPEPAPVAVAVGGVTVTAAPPAEADLATTVRGPATAVAGAIAALVADVRNNGSGTANARAILSLPSELSARAGTIAIDGAPAGNACSTSGRVIACRLGALGPATTVRITWQATVAASSSIGPKIVRSTAASPSADPVPANNPSAWTILVTRLRPTLDEAKLAATAVNDRATVLPSGEVRTTVLVRNTGSGAASGIVVCLPPPRNAAFASAPGATFRNGAACWSVSRLAAHSSRRFVAVLRVDATAGPGMMSSLARVTAAVTGTVLWARATTRVLSGVPPGRPGGVTG